MTATTRNRLAVPRADRTVRLCGAVLLAAGLLWLPVRQAAADPASPPAEAPVPGLTAAAEAPVPGLTAEAVAIDSGAVEADSLETSVADSAAAQAGAVDADTLDAISRAVGLRPAFRARGLRLDGSTGILREVDRRRWRRMFFAVHAATPSREPEREDSE